MSISNESPQPSLAPAFPAGARFGGFWVRLVAFIIDVIILKVFLMLIIWIFFGNAASEHLAYFNYYGMHPSSEEVHRLVGLGAPLGLISLGSWWLYFTLLESSSLQATLGKSVFGLKVVDDQGQRIGWGKANARYWSKILSTIILYIGFFMIGWTQRKQGLHDKIAETYVIKSR